MLIFLIKVWECHLNGVKSITPVEPILPDHKPHLKACFGADQVIGAVIHEVVNGEYLQITNFFNLNLNTLLLLLMRKDHFRLIWLYLELEMLPLFYWRKAL